MAILIPAEEFESLREARRGIGQKRFVELTQLRNPPNRPLRKEEDRVLGKVV